LELRKAEASMLALKALKNYGKGVLCLDPTFCNHTVELCARV